MKKFDQAVDAVPGFDQTGYDLLPKRVNEPHIAVELLLDVSSSMRNSLPDVEKAAAAFKSDLLLDAAAAELIEVEITAFSETPTVLQSWRPVSALEPVKLQPESCTSLGAALTFALDRLQEKCHAWYDAGVEVNIPQLVVITDAYPTDPEEVRRVAERVHAEAAEKKSHLWILGAPGYRKEAAYMLTEGKRLLEMAPGVGYAGFADFLGLISHSLRRISQARGRKVTTTSGDEFGRYFEDGSIRVPDMSEWING